MNLILDHWFLTPICIAAATAATTIGIGGPVFLTPLFMLLLGLSPATAVATALFTQCFWFLSGTVAYWQSGPVDRSLARRLLAFTIPAALIGSLIADRVLASYLRQLFGGVAVVVPFQVLALARRQSRRDTTNPTSDHTSHTALVDRSGTTYQYAVTRDREGLAVSTAGAMLLEIISVGLAELQSYHLIVRGGVPPRISGRDNGCRGLRCRRRRFVGPSVHAVGPPRSRCGLAEPLALLVLTVPGVLVGGQLGPLAQRKLSAHRTTAATAIVLFAIGGIMLTT